jgi:hypothetical protein
MDAREVAARCEETRRQLETTWSPDNVLPLWSPRCEVVVHATRASYRAAVGCGGEATAGSSWISVDGGRIRNRRIDLLAERQNLPALAHELAHVVLADVFAGYRPPPWADEGIAMLSDSVDKRRLHERDLQRAIFQRATWPLVALLTRESHPPSAAFPTFYAQSASVTAFLVQRGSPSQFVRFVKTATTGGYDRALADEYAIAGVGELERIWKSQARQQTTALEELACQGK